MFQPVVRALYFPAVEPEAAFAQVPEAMEASDRAITTSSIGPFAPATRKGDLILELWHLLCRLLSVRDFLL